MDFESLSEGHKFKRDYHISKEIFTLYHSAFQDENPIHIDESYALSKGFRGRVMFGGILSGFLSNFIGMHFPGTNSLILSTSLSFRNPSYLEDVISIEAEIIQKVESVNVLVLNVILKNTTQGVLAAKGKLEVKVV